ncbi:MAG: peptidoglycan DD-metalloendopeptidase family protein [Betaproteobacteria bacterium]
MQPITLIAALGAVLLAGCASRSPAPVDDRRPAAVAQPRLPVLQPTPVPGATSPTSPTSPTSAAAGAPGAYIVRRGDTLYSIALEHGVDYRELAQANKLDDPSKLRVGQELRVTSIEDRAAAQVGTARAPQEIESRPLGSSQPGAVAPKTAVEGNVITAPKALRLPYSEQNLALLSKSEIRPESKLEPKPEAAKPAVDRDPEAIEFAWPARGRVLQGFAEPNNKGLDISGKPGDPVLAAAGGRVMYTGTGIRGYGKLIVIKHDNNFNSVYAHNREILVKEGQNVTRGQRIAELGDTDADAPKLHFEIRKSGKPVDPARYLPSASP